MPQQHLDDTHVRAVLQQVRGEAVAQHVRRNLLVQPRSPCGLLQGSARTGRVHRLAVEPRGEQIRSHRALHHLVRSQHLEQSQAEHHQPLLASLGVAHKRGKGVAYQEQVTGIERGTEYSVPANTKSGKVLFDGYKDGKLIDAKDWNKWPIPDKDFSTQAVLSDARKQVQAAKGVPIEWHVSDKGSADLVRSIFKENNLKGIKVIHIPKS